MKLFYLSLIVIPFFISCSDTSTTKEPGFMSSKISDSMPFNSNNPFEVAGQLHNTLYESYYSADSLEEDISSISNRVTQLANQNIVFMSWAGSSFPVISKDKIDYILSNSSVSQTEIIESSLIAPSSKSSFSDFIDSVVLLCDTEDDYFVIYDFIVTYEESILSNTTLSAYDKKIILTTTSIARHSAYERKKRPKKNRDPEWDLMVGNIVAGIDGASDSLEKAVLMSLITGISENDLDVKNKNQ